MTTALADVDFINISKKELAAKLQAKSNDLILVDVPEKFARQDVDKRIRAISIIQASCSEKTVRVWVCRILGFCGYGDPVGYAQDCLWVCDGYGDRTSVPTAALPTCSKQPRLVDCRICVVNMGAPRKGQRGHLTPLDFDIKFFPYHYRSI